MDKVNFFDQCLSKKQTIVAMALSAGGVLKKIKEPERKSYCYFIVHPCSKKEIIVANVTVRSLKKKGVINEDMEFMQTTFIRGEGECT